MLKNQNTFLKLLLVLTAVQAILLYVIFGFIYLPAQKSLLETSLLDRLQSRAGYYFPFVKRSFESKNDISIMNSLEELTKDSEFTYARLIDNNDKIILHNKTQEWGKQLDDTLSREIIASNDPITLKTGQGYDYSIPIISSTTKTASFSVGISDAKISQAYRTLQHRSIKTALLIFAITLAGYILVLQVLIVSPLKQLHTRIESVILGQAGEKLDLKKHDEFGAIAGAIDKLIENISKK